MSRRREGETNILVYVQSETVFERIVRVGQLQNRFRNIFDGDDTIAVTESTIVEEGELSPLFIVDGTKRWKAWRENEESAKCTLFYCANEGGRLNEWRRTCESCPDLLFYLNALDIVMSTCKDDVAVGELTANDWTRSRMNMWEVEFPLIEEDEWERMKEEAPSLYQETRAEGT
ncbi:hypothetical protein SISNIDRAFT_471579 [Sistotremastrum niveocremeum HHB9708]|uniref:Uncharacterized protein n=1 Tax=Sistotremastrum niveocremeum HHB9708 TaxID=1314777 RepID=A0A164MG13_9AGAM|nr:hypothetical protein SISNIDRAFT_471579 [Sistotremastrum niveocremeum HHB9708]